MRRPLPILVAALSLVLASTQLAAADKPNILVVLVDDMGLMDSSVPFLTDASGAAAVHPLNQHYRTPNMERLAANGSRFAQFYAHSVCSPSRISLMTGHNSARHHTTQWIRPGSRNSERNSPPAWQWPGLSEGQQTLVGLLHGHGYRTIHAGKGHFGPDGHHAELPDAIELLRRAANVS